MEGQAPTLVKHPVLHCSEVDLSHPALLRVCVPLGDRWGSAKVWIPYTHVLGVLEVSQGDARQIEGGDETAPEPWTGSGGLKAQQQLH